MDSGAEVLKAQALLLKVFLLVGGRQCSEYTYSLSTALGALRELRPPLLAVVREQRKRIQRGVS